MSAEQRTHNLGDREICDSCGKTVRLVLGSRRFYGQVRKWVGHAKDCPARTRPGTAPRPSPPPSGPGDGL